MQVSASEPDPAIVLSLHTETRSHSQSWAWKANKPTCQVEAWPSHPAAEKPRSLAALPRKQITAVSGGGRPMGSFCGWPRQGQGGDLPILWGSSAKPAVASHPCTLACKDLQQLWGKWLLFSLDLLSLPFVIFRHWITSEEEQTEETHHISRKC